MADSPSNAVRPAAVAEALRLALKRLSEETDTASCYVGDAQVVSTNVAEGIVRNALAALAQPSVEAPAMCACGDRPANQCDEEWGSNCDLGNNEKHVRVSTVDPAVINAAVEAPVAVEVSETDDNLLIGQAQHLIGALMSHGLLIKSLPEDLYLKLWDVVKGQLRCVNREGARSALASQASTANEWSDTDDTATTEALRNLLRREPTLAEVTAIQKAVYAGAASEPAALGENERAELERLRALVNSPETRDFLTGVRNEVAHQVERWGTVHDRAKEPQDWFWLLGYLGGKALKAHADGDTDKALHHCISSAAVLANWHLHVKIGAGLMQPGSSDLQDFIRETFGANFAEYQERAQ